MILILENLLSIINQYIKIKTIEPMNPHYKMLAHFECGRRMMKTAVTVCLLLFLGCSAPRGGNTVSSVLQVLATEAPPSTKPKAVVTNTAPIEIMVSGWGLQSDIVRFERDESCTLFHLILKMGGLPALVNPKQIRVYRQNHDGTETEFLINVKELLDDENPDGDFQLQHGDRVVWSGSRQIAQHRIDQPSVPC